ncbi:MAG: twin-arginine translocase subunit TatB [Acidobacteria bacterium]|nr:twin-arginine translocase subunit TatB [Acidobacteriota bacterium]
MGSLGMQEIVIIFILALIVFGPRKLPELGKTIGKGLAEFKRASNELRQTWEDEVNLDKEKEEMAKVIRESTINPGEVIEDLNKSLEPDPQNTGSQDTGSQDTEPKKTDE